MTPLSAIALDVWDRCNRRYAFERDYEPASISPSEIAHRALAVALGSEDPEEAAKSHALALISRYDLDTTARLDSYSIAMHHGYLAGIVAVYLRRRLGSLSLLPLVTVNIVESMQWNSALFQDSEGNLHRIALVSHYDDDRLRAEAHSWLTIGEMAALDRPLTLHCIVVGPNRTGRRHSPWTKGLLHPANGSLRFDKRANSAGRRSAGFVSSWKDCWRENLSDVSTDTWLSIMAKDGVIEPLVHSRMIQVEKGDIRLEQARREMWEAQIWMQGATPDVPMRRSSCDETGRGACPFQSVCYSKKKISPEELPRLFRKRESAAGPSCSEVAVCEVQ